MYTYYILVQGVPKNMGIKRQIRDRLCYEFQNKDTSARVYFMYTDRGRI